MQHGLASVNPIAPADMPLAIANLTIDTGSPLTIYEQICLALRTAITNGEIPTGMKLPTAADLAQFLGIGRNTVATAYGRLAAEGYLSANRRRGTRVAHRLPSHHLAERSNPRAKEAAPTCPPVEIGFYAQAALGKKVIRFMGGVPFCLPVTDPSVYPRHKLGRRIANEFIAVPKLERSLHGHCGEYTRFQESIARYVCHTRGIRCTANQVLPVISLECATELCARTLIDPGHTVLVPEIVEDFVPVAFSATNARIGTMLCDAAGPCPVVEGGPPARLIFVSSTVQFPFGAPISERRRREILTAAHSQNAIIFENDCGHPLLYDGTNLSSIYALDDRNRTVYYGGLSEMLGLGTGLGFLVVPEHLTQAFQYMAQRFKRTPLTQICEAVACMIDNQEFAIHLRDVRAAYALRLRKLRHSVKAHLPGLTTSEPHGGVHLIISLPMCYDEPKICAAAKLAGLPVASLSHYTVVPNERRGLIVGIGAVPEHLIDPTIQQLSDIVEEHRI